MARKDCSVFGFSNKKIYDLIMWIYGKNLKTFFFHFSKLSWFGHFFHFSKLSWFGHNK
jgi:hypothetical protein